MNPTLVKLTEEIAAAMRAHVKAFDVEKELGTLTYKDIVEGTSEKAKKVQQDNGTFDVIISVESVDRAGEIVKQDGWDLSNYKNNPIVLWGHDYYSLGIGVALEQYNTTYKGMPALGARGVFYSGDINPLAQQVRRMYDFGLKLGVGAGCTTSVGFIPKDFDKDNQNIITRAELLEFSFVPIPAQQDVGPAQGRMLTVEEAKELGLDTFALRAKGLEFGVKAKAAQVGDACEMDDGAPGILANDPNDPEGPMVCVPQEQDKSAKDAETADDIAADIHKSLDSEHDRHDGAVKKAVGEFKEQMKAVIEDNPDVNSDDEGMKKTAEAEVGKTVKAAVKSLRGALSDEHDFHRATNVEVFRSFEPPKEKKGFDKGEHLKGLKAEHKGYDEKTEKNLDEFEKKMVEGGPGQAEEHTGWIEGKSMGEQADHRVSVKGIATKMCKDFGEESEGDSTEEKRWWMKGAVAEELAESEERQAKYKRVNDAWNVFDAFICAYLDDATPVGDFEKLLDETVLLMKDLGSNGAKGLIKEYLETNEKAGGKFSTSAKATMTEAREQIEKGLKLMGTLTGALGLAEPVAEVKEAEHDTPADKEFKDFLEVRDLARSLSGTANDFLSVSRDFVKDYYRQKKQ